MPVVRWDGRPTVWRDRGLSSSPISQIGLSSSMMLVRVAHSCSVPGRVLLGARFVCAMRGKHGHDRCLERHAAVDFREIGKEVPMSQPEANDRLSDEDAKLLIKSIEEVEREEASESEPKSATREPE